MIVYKRFEIEEFRGHDFTIFVEADIRSGGSNSMYSDEPPWWEGDIISIWSEKHVPKQGKYNNVTSRNISQRLQNAILNEYGDDYFLEELIEEYEQCRTGND